MDNMRIGLNATGVGAKKPDANLVKPDEVRPEEVQGASAVKGVDPNAVLDYLAKTSVSMIPQPNVVIDPAKYVDNESSKRIAGFMTQFEDLVGKGLAAFDAEFPGVPDDTKQAVVLDMILNQA